MEKNPLLGTVARVVLIIAMVVVGGFAVVGLFKIIPKTGSSLASAITHFSGTLLPQSKTLSLSLSSDSVASGEEVSLSFVHKKADDVSGSYVFRFDCKSEPLSFVVIDGNNRIDAACGSKTIITKNPVSLVPILSKPNSYVDTTLSVDFIKDESAVAAATGKTTLTVKNGSGNISQPKPTTPAVQVGTSTVISTQPGNTAGNTGPADLVVTDISSGMLINGVFTQKTSFESTESPSVRFTVTNTGGKSTGVWKLRADLPTSPQEIFTSPFQPSLAPGEAIQYTLTLENLARKGNNSITIALDTEKSVLEANENNNTSSITLVRVGGSDTYIPTTGGKADLEGRVLATGVLNPATGAFVATTPVSQSSRAAVRFAIRNTGGEATGSFLFTATLPTTINNIYVSPIQPSLAPGEEREYIIGFDYPQNRGNNTVSVRIDSSDAVKESQENDNTVTATIVAY